MAIEVGSILEGKVSGITKFGAFVDLPDGTTGMVHISEVASTYVSEIRDFVKENQVVKVKVLSLGEKGKVSLSMKQAVEQKKTAAKRRPREAAAPVTSPGNFEWQSARRSDVPVSFEDMMSKFKQTSEDKMSDLKRAGESRGYSRRGNGNGRR